MVVAAIDREPKCICVQQNPYVFGNIVPGLFDYRHVEILLTQLTLYFNRLVGG